MMENTPVALTHSCSVVVCTRNRPEALDRCLRALAQIGYPRFAVVVVDNTPGDDRTHVVARSWGARYVIEPLAGLSRARNTGARACTSDIIAYTDDDAVPDREWLARLVEEFREPAVAIVTGRILPLLSGAEASVFAPYSSDLGPRRITVDRHHPLWFELACFGGLGRGCNMAFRRNLFDRYSVFDERLGKGVFANGDEHRAFGQLIALGHRATYSPAAIVRHPVPRTIGELRAQYLASLSDLTGYVTFLFLRTNFRWKVVKYVLQAAAGTKRTWRFKPERIPRDLVSRWRIALAYAAGTWQCLRAQARTPCPRTGPGGPAEGLQRSAKPGASALGVPGE